MANQLYGYGSSSRSASDPFFSDPSSRYLSGIPSSSYLSTYDPLRYSSTEFASALAGPSAYSAATSRFSGGFAAGVSQPPWHASDVASTAFDPVAAGIKRSSEALYHQSILGAHNTVGQSEDWFSTNSLAVKRPRFDGASNLPTYLQRPGEKECPHYMLTRTCKFGDSCKFNHPIWVPEGGIPEWKEVPPVVATNESLPERPGEPDCPYFLKTQGCMFGMRCKFNHPKDKILSTDASQNVVQSGLPERPFDPPCAFYMKTGACKFGLNCKFDHPKDIKLPSAGPVNGNAIPSDSSKVDAATVDVKPIVPFTPPLLLNTKGLPMRRGEVDCPFYLKTGSCNYGAKCRYNHPEVNAIDPSAALGNAIVGAPAANLNFGVVHPALHPVVHQAAHPAAPIFPTIDLRLAQPTLGLGPTIYPQRPREMECDFYMKTGVCKFAERCKFHHPIDRSAPSVIQPTPQQAVKLTLAGLPRREGATMCPFYLKTGTCKYGAMCKFDHPTPGEIMAKSAGVEGKGDETH